MTSRRAAVLVLLATLAVPIRAASAAEELAVVSVDTSALPLVSVSLDVPRALASSEPGAEDFLVVENGIPVTAHVFAAEDEQLDVVLAVDTSGSMTGDPIADARRAALGFIELLPDGTRVAVVGFGDAVAVIRDLDDASPSPQAAVESLAAGGETSLYDAVVAAVAVLEGSDADRRVAVLLSDGGDTVSAATLEQAAAALTGSGAELHVVSLESDEANAGILQTLAAASGGRVVTAPDAAGLAAAYRDIADRIAARYRVAWVTDAAGPTDVAILVRSGDLAVRADVTVDLPAAPLGPVDSGPATTAAPPTTLHTADPPPEGVVVDPPSLLQGSWALPAGVGALLVGGIAAMLLALTGRGARPFGRKSKRHGVDAVMGPLTSRAETAADRVLASVPARGIDRTLDRAGIAMRPAEYLVLSASLGVTATILAYAALGPVAGVATFGLAVAGPRLLLRVMAGRRRSAFADQFEGTLQIISGSLRAGYGLMQAISTVGSESPSPTKEEFGRVVVENQLGRSVEDSLRAMSERMDNEDLRWIVEAIDIQYEVGGNLAEVLDTVAETIRDRSQIRRQVKALSAEGRLSAGILIALPFGLAAMIAVVSPDYLADLTGSTLGRVMIGVALVLVGIGAVWIKRIVKVVF